jgi:hypothetical protein
MTKELRIRNHTVVALGNHAKLRFKQRLSLNIDKHSAIDISKLDAVAVSTRHAEHRAGSICTYYLARIRNEDIVIVVEDSKDRCEMSTIMTDGNVVDAVWNAGIAKLEQKLNLKKAA